MAARWAVKAGPRCITLARGEGAGAILGDRSHGAVAFLLELVPALLVGLLLAQRWPGLSAWLAPPLGEEVAGGAPLGRVVSPYTFEELELIPNPVKRGIMILSHLSRNLIEPGDYGYMVGDMEGAES